VRLRGPLDLVERPSDRLETVQPQRVLDVRPAWPGLDESGRPESLEVVDDGPGGEPEVVGELRDRIGSCGEQSHDPQAGGVGQRLEGHQQFPVHRPGV
jgi:hypothetical protein